MLALAYEEEDRAEEARAALATDFDSGFELIPEDVTWLAGHTIYADVCAELEDRRGAELLLERLEPWSGQVVYTGISAWGDVDHALGRLRAVLGDLEPAELHLRASLHQYTLIEAPIWRARAQLDLGRIVARRLRAGDLDEAVELITTAAGAADRLGSPVISRRAHGLSNREIADQLSLSPATVKRHLKKIYDRVGVRNRAAVLAALIGGEGSQ